MTTYLLWIPPFTALIAFGFAYFFYSYVRKQPCDDEHQEIADYIRKGTLGYLKPHMLLNAIVFGGVLVVLSLVSFVFNLLSPWAILFFVIGGLFSVIAGVIGAFISPMASIRTLYANRNEDLPNIIKVGFRGGLVQGLAIVGLGILFVWLAYFLSSHLWDMPSREKGTQIAMVMLTFGFGASLHTLLSRVSSGIFAKSADVTADTISHTSSDLQEDDRNNPATLADIVGDNLTDGVGTGTSFFESYVVAMIVAVVLGALAFTGNVEKQSMAILLPIAFSGIAILVSIVASFFIKAKEWATQSNLNNSVAISQYITVISIIVITLPILYFLNFPNPFGLWGAISIGSLLGVVIIKTTERATSEDYRSTQFVAERACTSTASSLIGGVGMGMISTFVSVSVVVGGIAASYLATTLLNVNLFSVGIYGIALSALAMLAPLALIAASSLMGPIADHAIATARMTSMPKDEMLRVQALDSLGNTTATIGKNVSLLSTVLTGIALLSAYVSGLKALAVNTFNLKGYFIFPNGIAAENVDQIYALNGNQLLVNFNVFVSNPAFILGVLVGGLTIMFLSGRSIVAVGKISSLLIDEIRFRFNENSDEKPNLYAWFGEIFNRSQRETIAPTLFVILVPLAATIFLGVAGVLGMLVGTLSMGFLFAVFLANTGAIFDNAKKLTQNGVIGKNDVDVHEQVITGDTFGDPLKDAAASSIGALIKMVLTLAVIMSGVTVYLNSKEPPKPLDHHLFQIYVEQLDTKKPLNDMFITLTHLETNEEEIEETDKEGKFEIELKKGEKYVLRLEKEDYRTIIDTIDTNTLEKDTIEYHEKIPYLPYLITGSCEMRGNSERVKGIKVILQDKSNKNVATTKTDEFGDFTFKLQAKHTYSVKLLTDSLLVRNGYFATDSLTDDEPELRQTFKMDSKRENEKIELAIGFASGKFNVDSVAAATIDREVVQLLTDNPDVIFEFGAHTDSRGSARANKRLSQKRADAAVAYAISKGIPAKQIRSTGYGESQLKNDCADGVECSDEEHAENRRVEIKVMEVLEKAMARPKPQIEEKEETEKPKPSKTKKKEKVVPTKKAEAKASPKVEVPKEPINDVSSNKSTLKDSATILKKKKQ